MINKSDIDAFMTDNHAAAEKFAERAARGLPPDRWATTDQLRQVAKAYETLWYMYVSKCEEVAALQSAIYRRGVEAMRMDGED